MLIQLARRLFSGDGRALANDYYGEESLRPGATYEWHKEANMIERARIVAVEEDATGVPHIRFEVTVTCRGRLFDYGPRTMGADTFLARYRPVGA